MIFISWSFPLLFVILFFFFHSCFNCIPDWIRIEVGLNSGWGLNFWIFSSYHWDNALTTFRIRMIWFLWTFSHSYINYINNFIQKYLIVFWCKILWISAYWMVSCLMWGLFRLMFWWLKFWVFLLHLKYIFHRVLIIVISEYIIEWIRKNLIPLHKFALILVIKFKAIHHSLSIWI